MSFLKGQITLFCVCKNSRKNVGHKAEINPIPICETHHTPTQHTHNEYIIKYGALHFHPKLSP